MPSFPDVNPARDTFVDIETSNSGHLHVLVSTQSGALGIVLGPERALAVANYVAASLLSPADIERLYKSRCGVRLPPSGETSQLHT